jgi:hypothetical protein
MKNPLRAGDHFFEAENPSFTQLRMSRWMHRFTVRLERLNDLEDIRYSFTCLRVVHEGLALGSGDNPFQTGFLSSRAVTSPVTESQSVDV